MAITVPDANGNPISVGSAVKILATVKSINPTSEHFGEVELVFTNVGLSPVQGLGFNSSVADGTTSTPGIMKKSIEPVPTKINNRMLVVGS